MSDNSRYKRKKVKSDTIQVAIEPNNQSYLLQSMYKWIDNSNDMTLTWRPDGKLEFASKSIKTHLGYEPSELIDTSLFDLLLPEDVLSIKEKCDLLSTMDKETLNLSILSIEGEYCWFYWIITKVIDEDHDQQYYFATLKNKYNQIQSEEMLIQQEKLSIAGQLAAGIAHEIRNPLTSLKGFLQLLQSGISQKKAHYKIMIDEVDKIEQITSELLFISKPLTNKKAVESVNSMIQDVIMLLESQTKYKNIKLKWIKTDDINIICDRSQIKQVLINLIKNAIEATESAGSITVVMRTDLLNIEIDIIDEGAGILKENIHKLNKPFFTTKQGGTGLGLIISKHILKQHDGRMIIMQNKIVGSTFRIVLPRPVNKLYSHK